MTIDQAIQYAFGLYQSGRLGESEALYRQIVAATPQQATPCTGSASSRGCWVTPMSRSFCSAGRSP